jgi:hypothetical protein
MSQHITVPHAHMHDQNLPAFLLSLIAGLWMAATAGIAGGTWMQGMMGAAPYGEYGHPSGMYDWGGMYAWMYGRGVYGAGAWWPWFGLVAGFLLIVGGFAVYLNPRRQHAWGAAIIVISALDFLFGMGGLVAAVLGAVAGLVALAA